MKTFLQELDVAMLEIGKLRERIAELEGKLKVAELRHRQDLKTHQQWKKKNNIEIAAKAKRIAELKDSLSALLAAAAPFETLVRDILMAGNLARPDDVGAIGSDNIVVTLGDCRKLVGMFDAPEGE